MHYSYTYRVGQLAQSGRSSVFGAFVNFGLSPCSWQGYGVERSAGKVNTTSYNLVEKPEN